jgi:hypothetical protein
VLIRLLSGSPDSSADRAKEGFDEGRAIARLMKVAVQAEYRNVKG